MTVGAARQCYRRLYLPILWIVLLLTAASPGSSQVRPDSAALADSAKLLYEQAVQAYQHWTRESVDEAIRLWLESRQLYQRVGNRRGEGNALNGVGMGHYRLGRPDSALVYCRQALAIRRETRDRRNEGMTLRNIGLVHNTLGHPDSALAYLCQALAIHREAGDRAGEWKAVLTIGNIHSALGQADSALVSYSII